MLQHTLFGQRCTTSQKTGSGAWKTVRRRADIVVASAVDIGPSTSAPAAREYIFRRATQADCYSIAAVCGEAFGRGNFPGLDVGALDRLEDRYAAVITEDVQLKLVDALEIKAQAQQEHREFRLRRYMQQLRAELAALRGEPARFVTQLSPQDMRMVQRWRRSRQFMVLVAVEKEAQLSTLSSRTVASVASSSAKGDMGTDAAAPQRGKVVGGATLSLMQPEALLPAPFPSGKPFRLYVSNMSVLPSHRRRGLARRLLLQCERVARLWGHSSLWLHVKRSNSGAAALYHSMGYKRVESGGLRLLPGPLSQVLMCKELPALQNSLPRALDASATSSGQDKESAVGSWEGAVRDPVTGVSGGSRSSNGVFVWNALVRDGTNTAE
ncbi:hypothetical protein Vafri_18451 [Volvox africanus]|uniref:N-acetyltransferase domain-containing protein n=1 Tax=Volvox africanus TaxID=51714 RepID=A0A8J4BMI2_9CHLO|nr:hypothetical protein Vafri_18451 [Volvox africanus]